MRVLVIGASGQLGAALMETARARSHEAFGTYSSHPFEGGIPFNMLRDHPVNLLKETRPRIVFCPAGATHVDGCEDKVDETRILNQDGPLRLAQACAPFQARFVYYSTEYVFDGRSGPYPEDAPPSPLSVYGWTKSLGERLVVNLIPGGLAIRTTVIYGPDPQRKNTVYQLRKVLGEGGSFRSPTDQVTTPTYGPDLALASVILAERGAKGVIHVAGPDVCSRYDLSKTAAEVFGLNASKLLPCLTADLNQKAPRPLKAGLLSPQVEELTGVKMKGIREGLEALRKQEMGDGEIRISNF